MLAGSAGGWIALALICMLFVFSFLAAVRLVSFSVFQAYCLHRQIAHMVRLQATTTKREEEEKKST